MFPLVAPEIIPEVTIPTQLILPPAVKVTPARVLSPDKDIFPVPVIPTGIVNILFTLILFTLNVVVLDTYCNLLLLPLLLSPSINNIDDPNKLAVPAK